MNQISKTEIKLWLCGFIYGLVLATVGILMTGAGHGTYILLGIASAPLSFLGIPCSIISPPFLWSTLWFLSSYPKRSPQRRVLIIALIIHYLALLLIPFFDVYAEGKYIVKLYRFHPEVVLFGGAFYLSGQVAIWYYIKKTGNGHRANNLR
jgi:hypothetical protein